MQLAQSIKAIIRDVHDFPKPGIVFKDITPILAEPVIRKEIVRSIAGRFREDGLHAVVAIEARGFILGSLIAQELDLPFVPVRKSGKLPYKSLREEYALEYGTASIEIHEDSLGRGDRVLIHDDLLATGGTASAAAQLVQKLGATVAGFSFLINLSFLPGAALLEKDFSVKPFSIVTY
jgi:adenine phosphoribosyltransferase